MKSVYSRPNELSLAPASAQLPFLPPPAWAGAQPSGAAPPPLPLFPPSPAYNHGLAHSPSFPYPPSPLLGPRPAQTAHTA